ncbi:MAG: polysaccharide biosynthesis tyrosine autokinase [Bacteroidetes bacterium]|nr:polysaccharide biosynthesis tyrosine autokinase [Bacteroidota bacterium]
MEKKESNFDDWSQIEHEQSGINFSELASQYMIYWPLLFILLSLSITGAWTYIKYSPKIYGASSLISIKTENALGNNSTAININFGANQSNALDKELLLISSNIVFKQVVIKLYLYSEIIGKGSVLSLNLYKNEAPFTLIFSNPDSIHSPGIYPIDIDWKSNSVILDNKIYPFDQLSNTPFGWGVFVKNKSQEGKSFKNLLLSVLTVDQKASQIRSTFTATPKPRSTEMVDIQISDLIPQRAIDILDTLVAVYEDLSLEQKRKSLYSSSRFISERLGFIENEVSSVEKNISQFKSSNKIVGDISEQGSNYLSKAEARDQEIIQLNLKLDLLERSERYINDRNSRSNNLPAIIDLDNPSISAQLTQLIAAEEEYNRVSQVSGPENPKLIALKQQIDRLRPAIKESISNYRSNLNRTKQIFQNQQSQYTSMLRGVPEKERELINITRQQDIKNNIFGYLLQRREENVIALASLVGNTQFIIPPKSTGLISPKPIILYTYFIGTGLLLFVAFIVVRKLINNSYQSRTEVEKGVKAPILGEIIENSNKKSDKDGAIVINPLRTNIIGEQFREIRTNLMYLGIGGQNKVLLVTSSIPGEGKTFVAMNIAASLATTGKKVALLGFDLRKGKLGERIGVPVNPGICNYLVGQADLTKISHKIIDFPSLDILPEGLRPPNPTELIMNERMEKLMQELIFHYDYIVIDSPPIGSVTDARILAKYAYSTIYVLRHQYTPRLYFALIKDVYLKKRLPNLAIVLNGIKKHSFMGYSYGNGHNTGYGYGYGYGYIGGAKNIDT